MQLLKRAVFFIALLTSLPAAAQTKTLTLEADVWCPINCAAASPQPGFAIELAKKIFEPLGYQVNYIVVPWSQALQDVHSGRADGVIGASTLDDARLVFPATPLLRISDDFYVLNGNPWRYQGAHTLKGKRMGVVASYGYSGSVQEYIDANQSRGLVYEASGNDALSENMGKLRAGKIDVLVESKAVMDYYLRKKDAQSQVIWAGGVNQEMVYTAFSPENPVSKVLKTQYDAGIRRLKASGEYDEIYRRYGLNTSNIM